MSEFDDELSRRLDVIRGRDLYRQMRTIGSPQTPHLIIDGRPFLNFSSNDYLGLANEPHLKEAGLRALEQYGAGSGASRLICGSLQPHDELESVLAEFKGVEASLVYSSGYAAAMGTIGAVLTKDDIVVIDKLVHASIVDAARLCGAKLRVFAHNDLNSLADILTWADRQLTKSASAAGGTAGRPRVLVVTESVFSMDGDVAPLRGLVELKEKHGAWLMVDEAHATGIYGPNRRGLAEQEGVSDRIEVQMGTLGKALGASGGYVCGSRALIDYLVNSARSFIFSTAPVPAAAAAATAGIRVVQSADGAERCASLWTRVAQAHTEISYPFPEAKSPSAILPVIIGDEAKAIAAAAALREEGIYIPAIRYPTVARGEARLRVTLTAAHSAADVTQLAGALKRAVAPTS